MCLKGYQRNEHCPTTPLHQVVPPPFLPLLLPPNHPKKSSFRTELEPDLLNPEASLRDGLLKYNLNSKELPHDRLFKYILMLC